MKNKLLCYNKAAFEKIIKENNWSDIDISTSEEIGENVAFISICEVQTDKHDYFAESIFQNNHPNVIRLNFEDLDALQMKKIYDNCSKKEKRNWIIYEEQPDFWVYKGGLNSENREPYTLHIFNPIEAELLYNFIKNNLGKDFYIHCVAGASRSQGVVMFMLNEFPEYFDKTSLNQDNLPHKLVYNKWVTRLLTKAKQNDKS